MSKVVVGMSGGVDSSVAAYLLKEQGYDVIGVTMQIWQDEDPRRPRNMNGGCCGLSAVDDARRVADAIWDSLLCNEFQTGFQGTCHRLFCATNMQNGRTPNPCIACNRYVKWESLLQAVDGDRRGLYRNGTLCKDRNNWITADIPCRSSVTAAKDQTYALYNLTQFQLAHTLMPVGAYEKPQIRKIAEDANLLVAHKPDSQDICFVSDGNYVKFMEEETGRKSKPGNFVDEDGVVLGKHEGILALYDRSEKRTSSGTWKTGVCKGDPAADE